MLKKKNKKKFDPTETIARAVVQIEQSNMVRLLALENEIRRHHEKVLEGIDTRVNEVIKDLNVQMDKIRDELEEDVKGCETRINTWMDGEAAENKAFRSKQDRLQEHNFKHMTTVEDYVALQKDILSDVRDCLKVLSLDKMKGGKRVLNDSN